MICLCTQIQVKYWTAEEVAYSASLNCTTHMLGNDRAVSYTHLDVYKRQMKYKAKGKNVTGTGTSMKTMVIRTMRATEMTDYG